MTDSPLARHVAPAAATASAIGKTRSAAPARAPAAIAAAAGVSFKHDHLAAILDDPGTVGFLEVHAENYMGDGGHPHRTLERVRRDFPLSLHGVCMSIGGPGPLNEDHLARFAALVERYQPGLVSEHLAWSTHDDVFFNDLLPLPYTPQTLDRVCEHIDRMQTAIGRPILLENPATYVLFDNATMSETDFLRAIVARTGCGLLLDVNNVFVSATNHGYSARQYLDDFPLDHVGEIHLAGHSEQTDDEGDPLLIDSHDRPVADPVWALYDAVIAATGPIPTLVEWDSDLPEWPVLRAQAEAANRILSAASQPHRQGHRHALAV
ncbi:MULTISPECIES: DUF692 domain-containing protein [unclassified Roseitalea]|uniref:MNIO family bufferin maturase n=1 Tax=unclassified Roseitalea TaxID=2639107 RepID=UPI0027401BEC|nr:MULTISPECIES: DUF692 domain-containing protein [unclassified Roseitalea]